MIIDSHVHILPDRVRADLERVGAVDPWFASCHAGGKVTASVETLIAEMDAQGVDTAVCFTWPFHEAELCREANDYVLAAQRAHPRRIVAGIVVQPSDSGAVAELERCAAADARWAGELNADAQEFSLDSAATDAVAAACTRLGLPLTLHCSEPVGHDYPGKGRATPDRLAALAERHPGLRLVGAHLGGGLPFYAHMPEVAALCERLHFDTAALPFLYRPTAIADVIALLGAERLLFGSDFPLLGMRRVLEHLDAAGLGETQRAALLGGNAAALIAG